MAQEYIFRFLSVRPASTESQIDRRPQKVGIYSGFTGKSALSDALAKTAGDIDSAKRIVTDFRQTDRYVKAAEGLSFDVNPGLNWAQKHTQTLATDDSVVAGVEG